MSSPSSDDSESIHEHMTRLEKSFQQSQSVVLYAHNRVDSGDIAGTGEQFPPPESQTSWPRYAEIAPEDLELHHSAAGDLAVEMSSTPRQHPRRFSRARGGSQSFSCPTFAQHCSESDVAYLVIQRDKARVEHTQSDRSSGISTRSVTDVYDSYASSTRTSEDDEDDGDESANAHTPTQANTAPLNASRPSTPQLRSYASTEDGQGYSQQDLVLSSPPWSSQKRKRIDSSDENGNE